MTLAKRVYSGDIQGIFFCITLKLHVRHEVHNIHAAIKPLYDANTFSVADNEST
jgi:hypothetical protein